MGYHESEFWRCNGWGYRLRFDAWLRNQNRNLIQTVLSAGGNIKDFDLYESTAVGEKPAVVYRKITLKKKAQLEAWANREE